MTVESILFVVGALLSVLALAAFIRALFFLRKAHRIFLECERYAAREYDRAHRQRL